MRTGLVLFVLAVVAALAGCRRDSEAHRVSGDADAGKRKLVQYACQSCHQIPGIESPGPHSGPPLGGWARRGKIAGQVPNTPENLQRFLRHPQQVIPNHAMPDMGVSEADARAIASYLYELD